jgi:hypothetical protein
MGGYLVDTNVVMWCVSYLWQNLFMRLKDLKDVEAMRQVVSAVDGRWLVFCF